MIYEVVVATIDILYRLCYHKRMVKNNIAKPSSLESFKLNFEYDVTWQEAKQAVRNRTHSA